MAAHQAPPFLGFSRQEYWSGLPFPSPAVSPTGYLLLDMWSPIAYLQASFKTLACSGSDKVGLNRTIMSFHVKSKAKVVLECRYICPFHLYSFSDLVWSVFIAKRDKGLWTWVGPNSPPVSTKGHTPVGFCGGDGPRWTHLDTRKEHQANQEPWEVSLHQGLPYLGCLCLTAFA